MITWIENFKFGLGILFGKKFAKVLLYEKRELQYNIDKEKVYKIREG